MKNHILHLCFFLLFIVQCTSYSQSCLDSWARRAGGTSNEEATGMVRDNQGNIYISGPFQGTISIGATTLTSSGAIDVFIAKYDSLGNVLWAIRGGGGSNDRPYGLAIDNSSNLYLLGYWESGTATFGSTTLTSAGQADVFVVKINSSGAWQWAVRGGGNSNDYGFGGIAVDASANVYITGTFAYQGSSATFGSTTLNSVGSADMYIAKLNTSGTWQWAIRAGGTQYDDGFSLALDASSNIYVSGKFQGSSATYGSITLTGAAASTDDGMVAKLDNNGNWLWAVRCGGTGDDYAQRLSVDNNGDVVVSGIFNSATAAFGATTLSTAGGYDMVIAKINSAGAWQWAIRGGGTSNDYADGSIAIDPANGYHITGTFDGTASYGSTSLTSAGSSDIVYSQVNANGTWGTVVRYGGTGFERALRILIDNARNVYLSGQFANKLGFPDCRLDSLTSAGGGDIFLVCLGTKPYAYLRANPPGVCASGTSTVSVACGSYTGITWNTGATTNSISVGPGTYTATLTNGLGCTGTARITVDQPLDSWRGFGGSTSSGEAMYTPVVDAQNNVYVVAQFTSTATFGSFSLTSAGGIDIAVIKYSVTGNILWAIRFGGSGDDSPSEIVLDSSGNILISGFFQNTVTFGSTTLTSSSSTLSDIFVGKISPSGTWIWATRAGGSDCGGIDYVSSMAIDGNGNVIVVGRSNACSVNFGSINLSQSPGSGGWFGYVSMINSQGTWQWARSFGCSGCYVNNSGVAIDKFNNVVIVGSMQGTITLGTTTLTSAGSNDGFVSKLNSSGEWIWATRIGTSSLEDLTFVDCDTLGDIYVTGSFTSTGLSIGSSTLNTAGNLDGLVAKLSSSGNWLWGVRCGGTNVDACSRLYVNNTNNIYVASTFSSSTASFGSTTLSNIGGFDIAYSKLTPSGTWVWTFRLGGSGNDSPGGIYVDNTENVYISSGFANTIQFSDCRLSNITSYGGSDGFVARLGSLPFAFLQAVPPGVCASGTSTVSVACGSYTGITWNTGATTNSISVGPGTYTATLTNSLGCTGTARITVDQPLDSWRQRGGGTGLDRPFSLARDSSGNSVICGRFESSTMSFPGGSVSDLTRESAPDDGYIAKYNSSGVPQWAVRVGGSGSSSVIAAEIDRNNDVIVVGRYDNGNVSFPGGSVSSLSNVGSIDSYIAKYSASGVPQWAYRIAGNDLDRIYGISVLKNGDFVVTGNFASTVTFPGGSTLTSSGGADGFIARFSSTGSEQWVRRIGGSGNDACARVVTDNDGNSYVTGFFNGTGSFPGGSVANLTSAGADDGFVAKYDANGTPLWAQRVGGTGSDFMDGIAIDSARNVVFTGRFSNTASFSGGSIGTITSAGGFDVAVVKYNTSGVPQWAQRMGGTGSDESYDICTDVSGAIFVGAEYQATATMSGGSLPNLTSSGGSDAVVIRYSPAGVPQWTRTINGAGASESIRGIRADNADNVWVTGYFTSVPLNFSDCRLSTINSAGSEDMFIARLGSLPFATLAAVPDTVCQNGTTTLSATCGVYTGIAWNTGATTPSITVGPGSYTATTTNILGCSATQTKIIYSFPAINANAGSDKDFCIGSAGVTLTSTATGGTGSLTPSWTPAAGLSSTTILSPVASPATTTQYILTVTDSKGCIARDTVIVTV
ncbi:MAG: SBBP repeat-containing protein, partial [Candidatus Kapabacteria bacterium]|nr:SBBP repeat-containing protein [Candidatus Kapabacteria bacterium]